MAVLPRDLTVTFEVRSLLDSEPRLTLMGYPILIGHDVDLRLGKFDNVSVGYRVVAGTKLELDSRPSFGDTPFVHPNCRCAMIALETPDMNLTPPKVAAPKKRRSTTTILADLKKVAAKRNTVIRAGNEIHRKLGEYFVERERLTNLVADLNAEFNTSFSIETGGSK